MKKVKFILLVLVVLLVSGCTIDLSKYKSNNKDESNLNDKEEVEEIVSVGKVSSFENPLLLKDCGLASKYNAIDLEYKDVDVVLNSVNDEEVQRLIRSYNKKNSDIEIGDKAKYKFVVLEYEVTFVDFNTESFGDNVRLDVEILSSSNTNFVVDGVKQVIDVIVLDEDLGVVEKDSGIVKIGFYIPEDVDNYLVKLGTHEHTIAYYKV